MARSAFEELWNGIGDAIADIREKVVEEPMWGRVVTERGEGGLWNEAAPESPSLEPQGLSGEILPPEPGLWQDPAHGAAIEHGTVIENETHAPGRNEVALWSEGRSDGPGSYERERAQEPDIER
jgi:hypothetical protein